ncbi:MAG TPA: DUF4337 family protein [Phycisphaerae bacterium]|nr:DUF4337 family protein [Phycisphaerae bacterium]
MHDPTEEVQEHITHEAAHGGHEEHEEHEHHAHPHAAHHGPQWITAAALTAAVLAAFAAVTGTLATEHLTESTLTRIKANDMWSQYQSKSLKNYTLEGTDALLEGLAPGGVPSAAAKAKMAKDQAKHAENEADKESIAAVARANEEASELFLRTHETFELAETLFHISIAVVAIAVVAKRKEFWYMSMLAGVVGVYFFANALFHTPREPSDEPGKPAATAKESPGGEHPPGTKEPAREAPAGGKAGGHAVTAP